MPELAAAMPDPGPALGPEVRPQAADEAAIGRLLDALPPAREPALLRACLLLWHDRLEAAHALVQQHEGEPLADCLHAIMHRREPDEGNSCYWWQRAGGHPLAAELSAEARRLGLSALCGSDDRFDAKAMTRACCRGSLPADALRALQACELRLLAVRLFAP